MKFVHFKLKLFSGNTIEGTLVNSDNPKLPSSLSFDTSLPKYKTISLSEPISDSFTFIDVQLSKMKVNEDVETITIGKKYFFVNNSIEKRKQALVSVVSLLVDNERIHIPEQSITVLNSLNESVQFNLSDLGLRFVPVVKDKNYTENYFINNVFYFNDVDFSYNPKHATALNNAMPDIKAKLEHDNVDFVFFNARTCNFVNSMRQDVYMIKKEHFNK